MLSKLQANFLNLRVHKSDKTEQFWRYDLLVENFSQDDFTNGSFKKIENADEGAQFTIALNIVVFF